MKDLSKIVLKYVAAVFCGVLPAAAGAEDYPQVWPLGIHVAYQHAEPKQSGAPKDNPFFLDPAVLSSFPPSENAGWDLETLAGNYATVRRLGWGTWRRYPIVNTHHAIQLSHEGLLGEGHATMIFLRIEEDRITIDGAYGLYSDNATGNFDTSFTLRRKFDDYQYPHECGDCTEYYSPSSAEISEYRQGARSFFGSLPPALAKRIISDASNAIFILVDEAEYLLKLHEINRRKLKLPQQLTEPYLRSGDFKRDWTGLSDLLCLSRNPMFCPGVDEQSSLHWPQAHFAEIIRRFELSDVIRPSQLSDLAAEREQQPVTSVHQDKVIRGIAAFDGRDLTCFKRFTTVALSSIGVPTYVTAYVGEFKNGKAHGKGILFLNGLCSSVRSKPEQLQRLEATFENGVPQGEFTLYDRSHNNSGGIIASGVAKAGYLHGITRTFDTFGSEVSLATYKDGRITDGEFTFSNLDHYFLDQSSATVSLFWGGFKDNKLNGAWRDFVLSSTEYPIVGVKQALLFRNEMYLGFGSGYAIEGRVKRDHSLLNYRFDGPGRQYWPNGDTLEGTWLDNGKQLGAYTNFYDSQQKKWYPVTTYDDNSFSYEVSVARKRTWYENIGVEIQRIPDNVVGQINRVGDGFSHFMCRLTGTEEGKNCSVSGGVSVGTDGTVLTDGSGNPSEVVVREQIDWDARLSFADAMEMTDLDWAMDAEYEHGLFTEISAGTISRSPAQDFVVPPAFPLVDGMAAFSPVPLIYFGNLTASGEFRDDRGGMYHFAAPRRDDYGLIRAHHGTDYATRVGEPIFSPIDGRITYLENNNDPKKIGRNLIFIENDFGERVEIFYAHPTQRLKIGGRVSRGTQVGRAGSLRASYGSGVPNHIHVQIWVPGKEKGHPGYWISHDGQVRIETKPKVPRMP